MWAARRRRSGCCSPGQWPPLPISRCGGAGRSAPTFPAGTGRAARCGGQPARAAALPGSTGFGASSPLLTGRPLPTPHRNDPSGNHIPEIASSVRARSISVRPRARPAGEYRGYCRRAARWVATGLRQARRLVTMGAWSIRFVWISARLVQETMPDAKSTEAVRRLVAEPPAWLATLGSDGLGAACGVRRLPTEAWSECDLDQYPAMTMRDRLLVDADRAVRTGKVLVATGPSTPVREGYYTEDVQWHVD